MEPREFKNLVREGNAAKSALGIGEWKIQKSEAESRRLRRSLYIVKDVAAGEIVTKTNVRAIRPGAGCSPSVLEEIVGKTFKSSYSKGTPLTLDKLAMN
jgi:N-acetylneuraminate synthase